MYEKQLMLNSNLMFWENNRKSKNEKSNILVN